MDSDAVAVKTGAFMSILPTTAPHRVIPLNEPPPVEQPHGGLEDFDQAVDDDDDGSSIDENQALTEQVKPRKISLWQKWWRQIQSITYTDVKNFAKWFMESAKLDISFSVRVLFALVHYLHLKQTC